ncbi:carboxylating nicotinate-nucleotide diphosphorylase [Balneolaceae bacterium ANBcel3]|nr:carboxylating nicotinate-nucleotide diphosphorylase [Balneolaceae bacterium ANBcel3]
MNMLKWPDEVEQLVRLSLKEDIGTGDITTRAIYTGKELGSARLIAKENGIICGLDLAEYIGQVQDATLVFNKYVRDGEPVSEGTEIAVIEGDLASILSIERTILNFMQRMSGIATRTCMYTRKLASTRTRILDTRKTVPGHRYLDKLAVRTGGGTNHRMRLDDRFLIKENHIRMAGGIKQAISRCVKYKKKNGLDAGIEIEVTNSDELEQVLSCEGVDYVMLDNMGLDEMKQAVERINGQVFTEASGNVTLDNLSEIADTGVDFISSGALTHSVRALDISLLLDP